MYKVVLIDDEAIITEGLEKVVDWAAHNCRVAALAQDAASGTQAIRTHRPDILFTDIKMPGEDGLTMLAGLKGEFPRMQIAVLTGYRDFEYAQRAIRLGVSRFLLKPSKMDELNEALEYMTGVLDRLPPEADPEPEAEDPNSFLVRQAKRLMADPALRISEVAERVGYADTAHFSRVFKKLEGVSAGEWRNLHCGR